MIYQVLSKLSTDTSKDKPKLVSVDGDRKRARKALEGIVACHKRDLVRVNNSVRVEYSEDSAEVHDGSGVVKTFWIQERKPYQELRDAVIDAAERLMLIDPEGTRWAGEKADAYQKAHTALYWAVERMQDRQEELGIE